MSNQTEWQKWCAETAPVMAAAGRGDVIQHFIHREWRNKPVGSSFAPGIEHRIKPRTIRIGEYDVPEPMRKAPEFGSKCWFPMVHYDGCCSFIWYGDDVDMRMLDMGMVHSTKEAADLHGKALRSLTAKKD